MDTGWKKWKVSRKTCKNHAKLRTHPNLSRKHLLINQIKIYATGVQLAHAKRSYTICEKVSMHWVIDSEFALAVTVANNFLLNRLAFDFNVVSYFWIETVFDKWFFLRNSKRWFDFMSLVNVSPMTLFSISTRSSSSCTTTMCQYLNESFYIGFSLHSSKHFILPHTGELWLMKCFDIFFQFDIIIGTNRLRKSWRIRNFLAATCCFIILQRRATTYSTTINSMKAMMTICCPMISRSGKATFQWKTSTRWDSGETWIRWWSSIVAALETHADNIFAIDDNGFDLQASHLHASLFRPSHIGELHSGLILFSENSMQMYL